MLISDLVSVLNAVSHGSTKGEVTGVSYDSRKVAPGNLFVCIPGTKIDGHEFIPQALEQGARGLVTQRLIAGVPESVAQIIVPDTRIALARISSMWFHDPCKALRMIGVTGTNGKTTTTHLVKGLLEKKGEKVGLVGTIHNLIGDVELAATHTTPESWELMGLLDQMVQRKAHTVVMEVSSHALKQNRVAGCEFDGAVFTNLTQDHLDFHLNWEDYLNSKLKLFSNLHAGLKGGAKYAVINADDPAAPEFIRVSQVPVWTYGIREKAHIQATDIAISSQGTNFTLNNAQGVCPLSVPLTGTFNVYNVLAAVTVAKTL